MATTKPRSIPALLISSSIGKKLIMALSGLIAYGYVGGHLLGNLQIFAGPDRINAYAAALHSLGPMLWVIRAFLLGAFVLHIWLGIQLKIENFVARPVGYSRTKHQQSTYSSRTMIWTGLTVLAFVVYHLLHFTVRVTDPRFANLILPDGGIDVYSMLVLGFQNVWISGFYLVAVGLLCFHLSHGFESLFQTLGWNSRRSEALMKRISAALAILIFLGYATIPVSILAGWVDLVTPGVHP